MGVGIGLYGLASLWSIRDLFQPGRVRPRTVALALAGGTLLLLADTLARTVVAPQQLPVGVITAVLGVPTFIALLLPRGGRR